MLGNSTVKHVVGWKLSRWLKKRKQGSKSNQHLNEIQMKLCGSNGTRSHNHLVRKRPLNHLAKPADFLNDWAVLWVVVCTVHLTVCYYHVTYMFQSESTLYSCLNVKELLSRNRCDIWSLSDSNGARTHNHLVRKRTLN